MYARTSTHGVKVSIVPATTTVTVREGEKAALLEAVVVRHTNSLPLEVRSHHVCRFSALPSSCTFSRCDYNNSSDVDVDVTALSHWHEQHSAQYASLCVCVCSNEYWHACMSG